jgi:hypothetical protein
MRTRVVAVMAMTVAVLGSGTPAGAAGPVREFVEFSRVIATSPQTCPFDFVVHLSGTFQTFTYPDGSTKVTVAAVFLSYTNPVSGASLTTPLAGPFMVSAPDADGFVTVTIPGNDGRFVVPGEGVIFAGVGLLVYLADPDDTNTPIEIVAARGIQDPSVFPAVCGPLS